LPSSMKDSLDDKDQVRNTQSYIEKEENVAENVEGVNNTEGGNGFHIHQKQDKDDNSFDIDFESLTSNASHNDDEDDHGKGEYDINQLRHQSLEPSTPEDLVDD
jgi:Cu/Zn superoxide dismutase